MQPLINFQMMGLSCGEFKHANTDGSLWLHQCKHHGWRLIVQKVKYESAILGWRYSCDYSSIRLIINIY